MEQEGSCGDTLPEEAVLSPHDPSFDESGRRMDTSPDGGAATALDAPRPKSWAFEAGAEITPGTSAIALLGDGNPTETWLAWDTRRWAPVTVKICRPDHLRSERAIAGLR